MTRTIALLVALVAPTAAHAQPFTPSRQVELPEDTLLLVTHASSDWDTAERSKAGLLKLLPEAKAAGIPTVFLQASNDPKTYFTAVVAPTYRVASSGGEFSFGFAARHVILAGGHLELCQLETAMSVARVWRERGAPGDLRLTVVADATYMRGVYGMVRRGDAFYASYKALRKRLRTKRIAFSELLGLAGPGKPTLTLAARYADLLSSDLPGTHAVVATTNGDLVRVRPGLSGAPTITVEVMSSGAFAASQPRARRGLVGGLGGP
jgi:hypothetical protein